MKRIVGGQPSLTTRPCCTVEDVTCHWPWPKPLLSSNLSRPHRTRNCWDSRRWPLKRPVQFMPAAIRKMIWIVRSRNSVVPTPVWKKTILQPDRALDFTVSETMTVTASWPQAEAPNRTAVQSIETDATIPTFSYLILIQFFDWLSRNRRPGSRGFALDSQHEEDSFSGDGLEREKRWLDHFRERRGPRSNRSGLKDSTSSSKDSSRYSFSTEFSSGSIIKK